jgi:hypothetical protein
MNKEPGADDLFGLCPVCKKEPNIRHIGHERWACCEEHKVCWWVGRSILDAWNPSLWEANRRILNQYEEVEPFYWPVQMHVLTFGSKCATRCILTVNERN